MQRKLLQTALYPRIKLASSQDATLKTMIFLLNTNVNKLVKKENGKLYAAFIDFTEAFDK